MNCRCDEIHNSCMYGNIKSLKKLLDNGEDEDIEIRTFADYTPLHTACDNWNIDIVDELLNRGADINALNECCQTPLHLSCIIEDIEIVKLLINRGANVNLLDVWEQSALYMACGSDNEELVKLLLKNGANMNTVIWENIREDIAEKMHILFEKERRIRRRMKIINMRFVSNYWRKIGDKKQIENGSFTVG
jgi:ankyrin repeat protein